MGANFRLLAFVMARDEVEDHLGIERHVCSQAARLGKG